MRDTSWLWFWLGVIVFCYGAYNVLVYQHLFSLISVVFGGLIVYEYNNRLGALMRIKYRLKRFFK